MEEEELLARGIEYMSKEKDDLKHKMKQVLHVLFLNVMSIFYVSVTDIFEICSITL